MRLGNAGVGLAVALAAGLATAAEGPPRGPATAEGPSRTILAPNVQPIDLNTALRLAGAQNPELLLARQRVVEAVYVHQFAAAQIIPTLNAGTNYDTHTGTLQQSNGNILSVTRSAVYVGAGSFAVAAGTVSIPGLVLAGNVAEGVFRYLITKQVIRRQQFTEAAVRNQVLLRVATAYCELLRAEGHRAIAEQIRDRAAEIERIIAAYARIELGLKADADRAATELGRRRAAVRQAEGEMLTASARLARVLFLDPSVRLHPTDGAIVPLPIVPEPIPLRELVATAVLRRPELAERRVVIREALLELGGSKLLPFSPTILVGFSAGGFGGGSNLVTPVFGGFGGRSDFDAVAYWTLQNLGVGNVALINLAKAHLKAKQFEEMIVLDQVRDEVAEAHARTHARFAQIVEQEQAVRSSLEGFRLDFERIKQGVPSQGDNPRPIEVLDSLKLLRQAQDDYLDAIIDYNRAHFELYVALGQPPANALARPVPTSGVGLAPEPPRRSPAPTPMPPPPAEGRGPFARPEAAAAGR
ncbi:MAG TPA: TolC family protein [Isosphaeraceae bacterium]|jgi:outer membrane protein TolC|nr:TolC family protein [Isosphaeraceae bacterium]